MSVPHIHCLVRATPVPHPLRRRNQRLLRVHNQHQQPGQLLRVSGRRRRVSSQAEGDVQALTLYVVMKSSVVPTGFKIEV